MVKYPALLVGHGVATSYCERPALAAVDASAALPVLELFGAGELEAVGRVGEW